MDDGQVIKILRRIERLNQEVRDLIGEIGASDHPNAEKIELALQDECWSPASAEVVASHYLEHPERYAIAYGAYLVGKHTSIAKQYRKRKIELLDITQF